MRARLVVARIDLGPMIVIVCSTIRADTRAAPTGYLLLKIALGLRINRKIDDTNWRRSYNRLLRQFYFRLLFQAQRRA